MALPNVIQYSLAASNNTNVVNAGSTVAVGTFFTLATTTFDVQRRLTFTMAGNESANTFKIIGLNQAGNTISEVLAGKRKLNRAQITKLSRYFHIEPGTFLSESNHG